MKTQTLTLVSGILASLILCTPALAEVYLEADFDDKAVDESIGTGGAELGEPISVSPYVMATVRDEPMPTPFLEIQDNDDYSAGSVRFEFLGNVEVTSGFVSVNTNLWFPEHEEFHLYIREQGGSSANFTSLHFTEAGSIYCSDANGNAGSIGTYETGRHLHVRIAHNVDDGFYTIWLDHTVVLSVRYHGVVGHGIGRVLFGCSNDSDFDGLFYVDDVFVATHPAPRHYLRANFNNKLINEPIRTGGPEIGEPIHVDPVITAIVRDTPFYTPSLEIVDDDDYSAGYVKFEFIQDAEVDDRVLVMSAHLWFALFEDYSIVVREHGTASQVFSDVHFSSDGNVYFSDAGGYLSEFVAYEIRQALWLLIVHNLTTGTYTVYLDGQQVVVDEPHGIVGRGIGMIAFGCAHDVDYDGRFFVDNIHVSEAMPPLMDVCCMEEVCGMVIPMDCAYNSGEFHPEWLDCEPNPCEASSVEGITTEDDDVLLGVMPNPMTGTTQIRYRIEQPGSVRLVIVDAAGRLVRKLHSADSGRWTGLAKWDRMNDAGSRVGSGVYFARLTTDSVVVSQRMIVLE